MARTPKQAFLHLAVLYKDAHKIHIETSDLSPEVVINWASKPHLEKWAEFQVKFHGWSWFATEAVVRQCRANVERARRHVEAGE